MILLNFGLVLAAVALLIVGLGTGNVGLVWGSVGASVIAAACLALVATARRRGGLVEPAYDGAGDGTADGPAPGASGRVPDAREPERLEERRVTEPAASSPPEPEAAAPAEPEEHPAAEDVALVAGRDDLVLVIDGRPRYHLFTCALLAEHETVPLALSAARADGFTPCGRCTPDATLAQAVRSLADRDDA